jgi:diguanylate cyclase
MSLKLSKRGSVMLWMLIISFICGIIEFGEPLEDLLRGARDRIRQQEYTGNVVVVGIDDKTATHFKGLNYSRKVDATVVDTLFANGAKRVFYDKAFADANDPVGDQAFQNALKRHRGKIFLGAAVISNLTDGKSKALMPNSKFLNDAEVVSLNGLATPFGLSALFPYQIRVQQSVIPSMSAELSNRKLDSDAVFRPDWSIRMRTIPTLSLSHVYTGKIEPSQIAGRDIVIGPTSGTSSDIHSTVSQGWVHGVFFHVVAAETLQKGTPQNWGWLPTWLFAICCSVAFIFSNSRRLRSAALVSGLSSVTVLPLYFDSQLISADVVPAALLFVAVVIKASAIRRAERQSTSNAVSGLPNAAALRGTIPHKTSALIALKVRNYSEIVAALGADVEPEIISEVRRRIALVAHGENIYHEADTLLWFTDFESPMNISGHLEGLSRILASTLQLKGQPCDLLIAFGVDADHKSAIGARIGSAMLCAQEAIEDGQIWKLYDPERRHGSSWQISLFDSLDHAIDNGEIWVAYQPKADLKTGEIIGAEALARWSHPERGVVGPEQFVTIAERNNRIDRLTALVLDHAIEMAAKINRDLGPFNIAVNLSVQMLKHPNLLSMVKVPLVRHELSPKFLTLEVTETGKIPQSDEAIAVLHKLAEEGITLSLDDYGTGNATLEYLKLLPFGEVKIDRSFISNITHCEQDMILVKSTISMAHSLNCKVVGEGIETEEIRLILKNFGCDTAQGYHIGRPMCRADFMQYADGRMGTPRGLMPPSRRVQH